VKVKNGNTNKKEMVVGFVGTKRKTFQIVFPKTIGSARLRELKKAVSGMGELYMGRLGIIVVAKNSCCPNAISDLAYHIGEVVSGFTIDARTIPVL
jgi:hypothetical protein